MQGQGRPGSEFHPVQLEFLRADVDAGFAMLRMAEMAFRAGDRPFADRALAEAQRAYWDSSHLLEAVTETEGYPVRERLEELHTALAAAERMARLAAVRSSYN